MLTIKRILFPTDFTEVAERAFVFASTIADRFDAELHVLNVVAPGKGAAATPMEYLKADPEVPTEPRNAATAIPLVHAEVEDISPVTAVLQYVKKHDIDLNVMGTRRRGGLDRLVGGSVAEDLVRHSACPVVTMQQPASAVMDRIVVPVDFSDHSGLIITYGRELASNLGASLDVLHVVEEYSLAQVYGFETLAVNTPDVFERVLKSLEKLVADAPGADVPVKCHAISGNPVEAIIRFAEEKGAGMIVTATHGHSGIKRFLLGSVTERVVRTASCPVFTVKSFGKQLIAE